MWLRNLDSSWQRVVPGPTLYVSTAEEVVAMAVGGARLWSAGHGRHVAVRTHVDVLAQKVLNGRPRRVTGTLVRAEGVLQSQVCKRGKDLPEPVVVRAGIL